MAYYEQLTFTGKGDVEEAEETAIKLIRDFEELALQRCPDKGYIGGGTLRDISAVEMYEFYFRVR